MRRRIWRCFQSKLGFEVTVIGSMLRVACKQSSIFRRQHCAAGGLSRVTRYRAQRSAASYCNGHRRRYDESQGDHEHSYLTYSAFATLALLACSSPSGAQPRERDANTQMNFNATHERYSSIVVGGGTAGCTVAYLTAKWMLDNNIPGKVLLVDRGVHFFDVEAGPDPVLGTWFENWGIYGEAHPAVREDGTAYPVTGSDHRGIGGCGSHDTRITFQPTPETMTRFAQMMGWDEERLYAYYQAALNLMPLTPAIPAAEPEAFYNAVMAVAPAEMTQAPCDEHKTRITHNSIAQSTLAAYHNELRWTSAYLLHESVRPSNLVVVSNATADRVLLERSAADGSLRATGIVLHVGKGEDKAVQQVQVLLEDTGEIALTGGTFGAVGVLQRSGVGPRAALQAAGVEVLVDNEHVGHGTDHTEIAVMYEWLDKWNDSNGNLPRGGVMGWPLMAFLPFRPELQNLFPNSGTPLSTFMVAHFGAGCAEPYTEFPTVVCTPNCARPDMNTGYRAVITSARPSDSLHLVHSEQPLDWQALAQGVYAAVKLLDHYQVQGIVGAQLEPPFPVTAENSEQLVAWIRDNHSTVFHWACTCQAGVNGRVADAHFRVKNTSPQSPAPTHSVVQNLRVGSAASLPELPDANPHLTVTAFSVALAEELVHTQAQRRQLGYSTPSELRRATKDVQASSVFRSMGDRQMDRTLRIRRPGEEYPDVSRVAVEHYQGWLKTHTRIDDTK